MNATINGCHCHMVPTTCISCRARAKATKWCSQCGTGLLSGEAEEHDGLCTSCYYGETPETREYPRRPR